MVPPVRIDGDTYVDAVLNTATNIKEAIRRGADQLDPSQLGEWTDGFFGTFFDIFEATTVDAYKQVIARIERNNEVIAPGISLIQAEPAHRRY